MKKTILNGILLLLGLICLAPMSSFAQGLSVNSIVFKGDLRFRHETVDQENTDTRNMERLRVRAVMTARVENTVNFVFGLASGESNSPISSNQNFTGGFSKKNLWIDLAYFDWTFGKAHILGGKIKNPFYAVGRNQIVWDMDLNPEGAGITWSQKRSSLELFANGGVFSVEERSSDKDSYMAGGQAGIGLGGARIGAGFYDFINTKGFPAFYDSTKSYGNSLDAQKRYLYDFRILELFGEYGLPRFPLAPAVYFEYITNIAEDVRDNEGWQAGATLGKLADPGSWSVRWHYQRLERNAVIGAFTNSDFAGGGANNKGTALGVDYQISRKTSASVTGYFCQRGVENGIDYNRYQADLNMRF